MSFFRELLGGLKKEAWIDQAESKMLGVKQFSAQSQRCLHGIIEYGEFGTESSIKDTVERITVFDKARNHADLQRFYFLLSVPKGRDKGIVALQKSGNIGVATQLKKVLGVKFEKAFPEYRLRMKPLTTQALFDRYLEKTVT